MWCVIHGGHGEVHHGVASGSSEPGDRRHGGRPNHADAAAARGAVPAGAEAAADRRQHGDDGPADAPRPGSAGEGVRRPDAPPARPAPRVRRVDAGVRARGAPGAGRRVLEQAGDHGDRLPHLRPRGHGVRALRALLAPDEEAVRGEALQPAPRRDVARRARRVRGARARRGGVARRGRRQPRRAHLQPHQERHLPRRVRHARRRGARRVHRHPPGVLQAVRRVQHRRLHPLAQLGGHQRHQRPPRRGAHRARQVHRQDLRRAHGARQGPRHVRRLARLPRRGLAARRHGRRRRRRRRRRGRRPAEHAPPHPRQHQGHHHGTCS